MAIHPATAGAAPQIAGAIRQAAHSTGISFEYLLTTAQIESNLNPAAQASTSSAKGLYQFIDQTWLGTMKQDGAALGLRPLCRRHIALGGRALRGVGSRHARGDHAAAQRSASERDDGGRLTRNNATAWSARTRPPAERGELYIAHFLGADGAGKLIDAASSQPQASAAAMFPQRGRGQSQHLLRQLWPRAQRRRGLRQADRAFRHGAYGCLAPLGGMTNVASAELRCVCRDCAAVAASNDRGIAATGQVGPEGACRTTCVGRRTTPAGADPARQPGQAQAGP